MLYTAPVIEVNKRNRNRASMQLNKVRIH